MRTQIPTEIATAVIAEVLSLSSYGSVHAAGRVYRNHHFRACTVWGGSAGGAVVAYGWWTGPLDWGLDGISGAFGCAGGMIDYRWD